MDWIVTITGDETDLQELVKSLQRSDITIEKDNESYLLKSTLFSSLTTDQDVREKANEILIPVNAGIKIELGAPRQIEVASILKIDPAGKNTVTISRPLSFCIRIPNTSFDPQKFFIPLIDIVKSDSRVAKMCLYINQDLDSWFILYNILEILEEDGFKHVMKGGKHKEDIKRFTQTAECYTILGVKSRHANENPKKFRPPKNPMSLHEAQNFMKILIKEWLDEKRKK